MPELKQLHKFVKANDNMEMLTVSMDSSSTSQALRDTIRKHRIKYPVLHVNAEDGWIDGAFDWEINALPSSFLIDPQGTIMGEFYANQEFQEALEYLTAQTQPVPAYGLEVGNSLNDDGSYRVAVKVTSPDHQPISVLFEAGKTVKQYMEEVDGEWVQIDPIPEGKKWNSSRFEELTGLSRVLDFTFDRFGESTQYIDVPAVDDPNLWIVLFRTSLRLPGSQSILDGMGISVYAHSNLRIE